jgi:hypothetical protein
MSSHLGNLLLFGTIKEKSRKEQVEFSKTKLGDIDYWAIVPTTDLIREVKLFESTSRHEILREGERQIKKKDESACVNVRCVSL